jgi:hypothetical protein
MPKVELRVVRADRGLIEAPDFCPFAEILPNEEVRRTTSLTDFGSPSEWRVIHASICKLCGLCQFYLTGDDNIISEGDLKKVVDVLTQSKELLTTVMNQVRFLQKNDRDPLAILISFETLKNTIYQAFQDAHFDKKLAAFSNSNAPICVLAGLPLYFSAKLVKSPVQVVGEVEWNN